MDEIVETAVRAVEDEGYKLIVLQSGEDMSYSDQDLLEMVKNIKKRAKVFIFLSVGERSREFYKKAKAIGASGSLMRFETSSSELYEKLRPNHILKDRISSIEYQTSLGYYIASGNMVGLPGQSLEDIAEDLLMIKKLSIPMISAGPWIPASNTPLELSEKLKVKSRNIGSQSITGLSTTPTPLPFDYRSGQALQKEGKAMQVELFLKYIAVARFMMPEIKIPVTTALETLDPENGRRKGLLAGANALMFNLTPEKYCENYNIYDNKYREREKVWQKYGLFKGEESYEMLEDRLSVDF